MTLNELVKIFKNTYKKGQLLGEIEKVEMEIYETPTDNVCMALFVYIEEDIVTVGTDDYLVVSWKDHEKVIQMLQNEIDTEIQVIY